MYSLSLTCKYQLWQKFSFRAAVNLLHGSTHDEQRFHLDTCVNWLKTYFEKVKDVSKLALPVLCPIASGLLYSHCSYWWSVRKTWCSVCSVSDKSFRDRVLMSLAKSVPAGTTITYGELASLAGSPGKDVTSSLKGHGLNCSRPKTPPGYFQIFIE